MFIITALVWTLTVSLIIDSELFNAKLYNYIMYKSDCNYKVPSEYHLAKMGNRYVIYREDYGKHYLTSFSTAGLSFIYADIREPSTFADTCAAKGALKAYIKSIQPLEVEEIRK